MPQRIATRLILWLWFMVTTATSRKTPSHHPSIVAKNHVVTSQQIHSRQQQKQQQKQQQHPTKPTSTLPLYLHRRGGTSTDKNPTTNFLITYLAYTAIYFARKPVSIVKSTLETELGLTRSQLGNIDTSLLFSYAAGQILLGQTVATFGRILPVVGAYVLCGLFTGLFGSLNDATLMALFWGVCGFGAAAVNPLLVLYVADLYPKERRASMVGLWQTSQQMGGIVSNTVASYVLVTRGWRSVFYASGAIVAFFAVPLLYALKQGSSSTTTTTTTKSSAGASKAAMSPFAVPGAISVGMAYTLTKMTRYCLMMWLPYFLTQHVGMGPASSGIISTIFDITGATGSILSGTLVDKCLGGRMIFVTLPACILSAVSFILWGFLGSAKGENSRVLHVAMMGIVGFLIAGPDGILGGAASRNLVDYAGFSQDVALPASVSGMVNGCGSLGAILQGSVTAKVVDKFGWSGLFFALGGAMTVASLSLMEAVRVEGRAMARKEEGK